MQDESGNVPNYGANDGALIIPLNNCDYIDYRPVINSSNYYFKRTRLYSPGPWDEDLFWLFGDESLHSQISVQPRDSKAFDSGGYYTIRKKDSWLLTRCHTYKDRPGHADALNVDLWWRGMNIVRDNGSYMYNCEEPWQSFFKSTSAHNIIRIDGKDQMINAGRFMWHNWIKAQLQNYEPQNSSTAAFTGTHKGYKRKGLDIIHSRSIYTPAENLWIITDEITGTGVHLIELFWHIDAKPQQVLDREFTFDCENGQFLIHLFGPDNMTANMVNGNKDIPNGWVSRYYGEKQAAPTIIASCNCKMPVKIITVISFDSLRIEPNQILKNIGDFKGRP